MSFCHLDQDVTCGTELASVEESQSSHFCRMLVAHGLGLDVYVSSGLFSLHLECGHERPDVSFCLRNRASKLLVSPRFNVPFCNGCTLHGGQIPTAWDSEQQEEARKCSALVNSRLHCVCICTTVMVGKATWPLSPTIAVTVSQVRQ